MFILYARLYRSLVSFLIAFWIIGCGGGSTSSTTSTTATTTPSPNFILTGNMNSGRFNHTATLLSNGKVLIIGGLTEKPTASLNSAEIYDPASGLFTPTGSLNQGRADHTATLLNSGMVLVVGGEAYGEGPTELPLGSAELYDPGTGTFSFTGTMRVGRVLHTATLLNNGLVLIVGGINSSANNEGTAELYNPATGMFFSTTGNPVAAREHATATVLNNGSILISGGYTTPFETSAFTSAEIFNPATGTFTATGNMNTPRGGHTATLLNNGTVLIAGGFSGTTNTFPVSAEIFNPATGAFTATGNMNTPRGGHSATLLNNGTVVIAGGVPSGPATGDLSSAELYSPSTQVFSAIGFMNVPRDDPRATLLEDGIVLLAGGSEASATVVATGLSSAELYQPNLPTLLSIAVSPVNPTIIVGASQTLIATGTFSDGTTSPVSSVIWSSSNPGVSTVSNDATNKGTALGVAPGTAAITATSGSVAGSTTITVN